MVGLLTHLNKCIVTTHKPLNVTSWSWSKDDFQGAGHLCLQFRGGLAEAVLLFVAPLVALPALTAAALAWNAAPVPAQSPDQYVSLTVEHRTRQRMRRLAGIGVMGNVTRASKIGSSSNIMGHASKCMAYT